MSENEKAGGEASKAEKKGFLNEYVKPWGAFAFLLTIFGIGYAVGNSRAESAVKEQVDREKNDGTVKLIASQQEGAKKEQELRQCLQQASALQAVVALSQSDRDRLLALTTTEPSLKVSLDGKPLVGKVTATEHRGEPCFDVRFWLENTGRRDVRVEGLEWITPSGWYTRSDQQGQTPTDTSSFEGDETRARHWLGMEVNLPPSARRFVWFDLCTTAPVFAEFTSTLTVNATGGFLPLAFTWTLLPPKK